METFGIRITKLRKENNMTQDELAKKLNISRQALSAWERDKTEPDITSLTLLSKIFNVDLNTLLGGISRKEEKISTKTMLILYILILITVISYSVYKIKTGSNRSFIINLIPFVLVSTTIYFAFSYSIKSKDFSMIAGYDSSIKYNKTIVAKMLNTTGTMILIDTLGYVMLGIIVNSLVESKLLIGKYTYVLLFIGYIITFVMAIVYSNYKYKDTMLLNPQDRTKYKSLDKLNYAFLGFIVLLIAIVAFSNIYFKIPNNTPRAIGEIFIILPMVFINVIILIIEQDNGKKLIEQGKQYQFTKKVKIVSVFNIIFMIAIVLIAAS